MNHRKITSLTLDEPISRYKRHHESLIARQPFQKPIMSSLIAHQIQQKRVTLPSVAHETLPSTTSNCCNLDYCQLSLSESLRAVNY